jgi:hypothetical protein
MDAIMVKLRFPALPYNKCKNCFHFTPFLEGESLTSYVKAHFNGYCLLELNEDEDSYRFIEFKGMRDSEDRCSDFLDKEKPLKALIKIAKAINYITLDIWF